MLDRNFQRLKYSTEPSCVVSPFIRTSDDSILTSLFEPHTLSWSVRYVDATMLDFSQPINLTLSEEIQGEKMFADYIAIGVRCYQNANQMELHKFAATNLLLSVADNNFTVLSYGENVTLEFGQITLPNCHTREIVLIGYGGYDTANTRNFATRQELDKLYPA